MAAITCVQLGPGIRHQYQPVERNAETRRRLDPEVRQSGYPAP